MITQQKQHYIHITNTLQVSMVGAFAHVRFFFVRDYDPEINEGNVLARMLDHKEAIISSVGYHYS
jgi:photosystem I P700 chlorophyll a apoprotein A2